MTSMTIVKARGEIVQPAMMPISTCKPLCYEVSCCEAQLQVFEVGFYYGSDGRWNMEEVEGFPEKVVGNRTKGIGQVEKDDMKVFFVLLHRLDLVPDHTGVLQATREPRNGSLLHGCIDVLVLLQVGGQFLC